ncbi:MAG: hypothetical protein WCD21_32540 [Streptomyces sp.]
MAAVSAELRVNNWGVMLPALLAAMARISDDRSKRVSFDRHFDLHAQARVGRVGVACLAAPLRRRHSGPSCAKQAYLCEEMRRTVVTKACEPFGWCAG